jgi:hypothetical protein
MNFNFFVLEIFILSSNNYKEQWISSNFMELGPSSDSISRSGTQEFPKILLNPKIHHRVLKNPPLTLILSQLNPIHTAPSLPP